MWHYLFGIRLFRMQGGPVACLCFGIFFFALQLFLCLMIRRKRFAWTKLIPPVFLLTEWFDVLAAFQYEKNEFHYYTLHGFHFGSQYLVSVPSSVLGDMFYASCVGVLCAAVVYIIIWGIRRHLRKRNSAGSPAAGNV